MAQWLDSRAITPAVRGRFGMNRDQLLQITDQIIGAAMRVQSVLGPGLLESVYQKCLAYELRQRGLHVEEEKPLPVTYGEVELECGYRLDLLVERSVIVELKAVDALLPVHLAQLLSYLRLANLRIGLLINFHTSPLRDGIKRVVNNL